MARGELAAKAGRPKREAPAPKRDGNPLTGRTRQALITVRVSLASGDRVVAYRLSDTVYLEAEA